jgi:DNA-binding transcriptional LysR family regulator
MELHQVRYFLAVARTLNFTRAAEECNVSQPSLSRAIRLLEGELGGDLFRRERPVAQLTSLGHFVLPHLQQCFESALGARSLADSIRRKSVGSLTMVFSHSIDLSIVVPRITPLQSQFKQLQLRFLRGTADTITETLKEGGADLAVASTLGEAWERMDRWPLFEEGFVVATGLEHRLARRESVTLQDLSSEHLVMRPYCESLDEMLALLREAGVTTENSDEIASDDDLATLLACDVGVAVVPRSAPRREGLVHIPIEGLSLSRTVWVYGVAGRQHSAAVAATLRVLRGSDWTAYRRPGAA